MNKKVAVIIPAVITMLESDLLEGIRSAGAECGCDVIVLTNSCNTMEGSFISDSVMGEYNIYRLLDHFRPDGIIFAAGRYHKESVVEKLMQHIIDCGCPAIVLEHDSDRYPVLYPDQKRGIQAITEHLIRDHGFKNICCLTGVKGSKEAEERLLAFRETMEAHDLPCSEEQIFYGDFWTASAQVLADRLACGDLQMPEAFVCANDIMAVSLIQALKQYGISVPDQLAVTGYDGDFSTLITEPTVTTVCGIDWQLGERAMQRLWHIMTGEPFKEKEETVTLRFGNSCGCKNADTPSMLPSDQIYRELSFNRKYTEIYMNDEFVMTSARVESLEELMEMTANHVHLIPKWDWVDICLCTDWLGDFEDNEHYRTEGYSDRMLLMLSKHGWGNDLPTGYSFPTGQLLPALQKKHDPLFLVFTPLQYGRQVFGYLAISYKDARNYYMGSGLINWRNCVKNGLYVLRKKLYIKHIQQKMEELSTIDVSSGLMNKNGLMRIAAEHFRMEPDAPKTLILLSWSRTTIDNSGAAMDDSHLVANVLQLYSDAHCAIARLSEKVFAIILQTADAPKSDAERFLLKFEEMLQSIYKKKNALQFPEIRYIWNPLSLDADFEQYLEKGIALLDAQMQSSGEKNDYTAKLRMLHRELYRNPQDFKSPDAIAEELHISKSYFQLLYKKQFSIAFHTDLLNAQLDKAKHLLRDTTLRIYEIAESCGFINTTHFMKQFKAKVGMTPMQYRQENASANNIS